jgi:hypothetical protein
MTFFKLSRLTIKIYYKGERDIGDRVGYGVFGTVGFNIVSHST